MTSILDLPAELVISVASHLNTAELGPLRRSCKQLEQHLFETFATEFFTKRQFMIEYTSLKALVDISNHPTLSDRLVEVLISTDMFEHPGLSAVVYSGDNISREWLLRTGQARDMLTEAFSKLKNLRIVGLRDFNSKGRAREGSEALWKSYGWSTNLTGLTERLGSDRTPGTLFSLLLWALGTASAFPPDIQVILRRRDTLGPHAFKLNAINAPVVSKLKSLFLTLHEDNNATTIEGSTCDEAPLRRFLHTASNLEVLRLNSESQWSAAFRLLDWLGTPPSPTDCNLNDPNLLVIPPAPLCNLTTLEIGVATVSGSSLARALSRFKLKSFSLWRITLSDKDPYQLNVDLWAQFLGGLSEALGDSDCVQKIVIGLLAQISRLAPHSTAWEKVQICPEGTGDKAKVVEKELQKELKFRACYGLSASQWLRTLAERTYVQSIHAPPVSPGSDGEEEEYQSGEDLEVDEEDSSESEDEE